MGSLFEANKECSIPQQTYKFVKFSSDVKSSSASGSSMLALMPSLSLKRSNDSFDTPSQFNKVINYYLIISDENSSFSSYFKLT
jgi:hypothetical protein